jgi:hypothetical protein
MNEQWPDKFEYRGAKALCRLHEERLLSVVHTWEEARKKGVVLPETEDRSYESLDSLLFHILACAGGYLKWCCEVLDLPDPEISPLPPASEVAADPVGMARKILARWRTPLAGVEEMRFYRPEHSSRWSVLYCVDAMLEHAVMHPVRHEFQLRALIANQTGE